MDNSFNKKLGAWLREKRQKKNISQVEAARRMGCVKSRICNWEKGTRGLDAGELFRYCAIIGADLNEFVEEYKKSN